MIWTSLTVGVSKKKNRPRADRYFHGVKSVVRTGVSRPHIGQRRKTPKPTFNLSGVALHIGLPLVICNVKSKYFGSCQNTGKPVDSVKLFLKGPLLR